MEPTKSTSVFTMEPREAKWFWLFVGVYVSGLALTVSVFFVVPLSTVIVSVPRMMALMFCGVFSLYGIVATTNEVREIQISESGVVISTTCRSIELTYAEIKLFVLPTIGLCRTFSLVVESGHHRYHIAIMNVKASILEEMLRQYPSLVVDGIKPGSAGFYKG